jgi:hypothetical protein
VFKFGCSSRGVQDGCCEFLVSIFRWSKPPHHVKENPLSELLLAIVLVPHSFVSQAGPVAIRLVLAAEATYLKRYLMLTNIKSTQIATDL